MTKLIYQSQKTRFAILVDGYQWILSVKREKRGKEYVWRGRTYFPTICLLLDELAETVLRRSARRVKELKNLDKAITRIYRLNARIGERLKKKFPSLPLPHSNDR